MSRNQSKLKKQIFMVSVTTEAIGGMKLIPVDRIDAAMSHVIID